MTAPHIPDSGAFSTRTEYDHAVDFITEAATLYYTSGTVLCDDATYDLLVHAVVATEHVHPEWPSSSVHQVAAGTLSGEVAHAVALLSLDNVFNTSELEAFCARVTEMAGTPISWTVEPKFDGMAVAATYENGRLVRLATRGDGVRGEDVSHVLSRDHIAGLPANLNEALSLEVRGEMFMTDDDFASANEARSAAGDTIFVNQRNAVAGAVRSQDRTYALNLSFCAYDVVTPDGARWKPTHGEAMSMLADVGVTTTSSLMLSDGSPGLSRVTSPEVAVARIERLRPALGFPVDGAVIKADTQGVAERLGSSSRAPRWAIAYKYAAEMRMTTLLDIDMSVGRTGRVTPVAVLEPVFVGGVTVTSATLHNPSEVTRRDVRPGDTVWVRRAGDVVPEVVGPVLERRSADSVAWSAPTVCPRCGGPLDTSAPIWRCVNPRCGTPEAVRYFASRKAMDIDGLGDAAVRALIDAGLVDDVADLFSLPVAKVAALPGFGKASAANLLAAIDAAKSQGMARVLTGLGARFLGRRLSERVAAVYASVPALLEAIDDGSDTLDDIDGFGPIRGASIRAELTSLRPLIDRLGSAGVSLVSRHVIEVPSTGPLTGLRVLISGKVEGQSRDSAAEAVKAAGATVASSVSKKLDVLIVGVKPGASKVKAAEAASIKIVDVTAPGAFDRLLVDGIV